MDGMTLAVMGILVHDSNDRTAMGMDETSGRDKREINDGTLPNTSDIGTVKVRCGDNADVGAGHAAVGTAIHEGTQGGGGVVIG
jgi:hypothetical protein